MKVQAKLIVLLVVALVGVTQLYRSESDSPIAEANARLLATTLDPTLVRTRSTRTTNVLTYCGAVTRTTIISAADVTTAEGYYSTLKTYFNADA